MKAEEWLRRVLPEKLGRGRPGVETRCPKCGKKCKSWQAAQAHCKPEKPK